VRRGGVVNARRPGQRPGRSEAKSIDGAEHGASIKNAMVRYQDLGPQTWCFLRDTCVHARTISIRFIGRLVPAKSGHEDVHAGGAFVRHKLCAETATCGTTNDGVNDPVPTAWVTREAGQRGRSRHRWCCDVGTGALERGGTERRLALLCAAKCAAPSGCRWFALMEQPGVRDCRKRASELGGQPDAIFAWPPVWPRRRGPSCR
jgi:hypothetical protein